VAGLDGVWEVHRVGGLLPPLFGVKKRIHGTRGQTRIEGFPGVSFTVEGLRLRYDAPFGGAVDVLEPDGDDFRGTATVFGREYGRFQMRRVSMADELKAQLIKHIDEAHAMEQNVLRMLDGMIQTTDDPEIIDQLEHHKMETQRHSDLMEQRLQAHDASPSMVKQAGGILQALAKMPLDMVRGEKAGRNARDGYATEHLEIASYELLKRIAQKAGDEATANACEEIIKDERAMAEKIEQNWDRFAALSLQEEGIATGA
jgi:ferritin-like metal-binding protein YciE